MNRRTTQPRGFAMVVAIVLIGIVALTLVALQRALAFQSRRTLIDAEDAQLRQLLLSGAEMAKSQLPISSKIDVSLPAPLQTRGGSLILLPATASSTDQITIQIEAALPKHRMSEHVTFARQQGTWEIVAAVLGP